MSKTLVRISDPSARYTATGKLSSYSIECFHDGLKDHRELKSSDYGVLLNKVQALLDRWEEKWQKALASNVKVQSAASADTATSEAQRSLDACERILGATLEVDDRIDWNLLKDHKPFVWEKERIEGLAYESRSGRPISVEPLAPPAMPSASSEKYIPRLGILDHLLPFLKRKKVEASSALFDGDLAKYEGARKKHEQTMQRRNAVLKVEQTSFEAVRIEHEQSRAEANAKVDQWEAAWRDRRPESVIEHAELVLGASRYPDWMNPDFALGYVAETGMLIVDYQLPAPDRIPTLERVTYVKSRNETTEKHLTEAKAQKLFDSVCYQIALRTIHELFEADEVHAIQAITFNGWVEAVNKATGRTDRSCILSVQALKEEFLAFDLSKVDAKACFKALKGVAASSLSQLAAIRPVLQLDRNDSRFVDSYEVAGSLDESTNLAAMSWEDFEHLVRELFGKIFSGAGAEVRVTQASRDGGVDAVALDPDPIRGGKTVIQAKRYTGTVGVSAVRDLYGTVMNEGANRGILVTTSNFGPDAYKFAAGKPLTLLNGSNLLSLLGDHGHKAKIDLAAAKRLG